MENILDIMPVGNLLRQKNDKPVYQFFIPSYQRGYRWDKDQVEDLLDDLFEFINKQNNKEKYCLQPIVVKQLPNGRYEVLDGQQRLTTIFILLSRLKETNSDIDIFSLTYETRSDSEEFLRKLSAGISDKNPDYYYISLAYTTINDWLKKKRNEMPHIGNSLFSTISGSVEFIWFEIKTDIDPIDVFTRINIGKIPLTNAELVKAVCLSKNNLTPGNNDNNNQPQDLSKVLLLRQNIIALEWDRMEKTLQDPKVWGFVYGGAHEYETRIDYILDLCAGRSATDRNKYHSFKFFYDQVKNSRIKQTTNAGPSQYPIEKEWNRLKDIFDILLEWYQDKKFNHLVGFLIKRKYAVLSLIEVFKGKDRKEFWEYLKNAITRTINCDDLSSLRYGAHNEEIMSILLLHNVTNSLLVCDNNINFPFEKLDGKTWSLEHIFAQNSDELKEKDYESWLRDHLYFFENNTSDDAKAIISQIQILLNAGEKKINRNLFEECFKKISDYIQHIIQDINNDNHDKSIAFDTSGENEQGLPDINWINDDDSIANLALLDLNMNSSLQNSLFDIKRRLILQKDKEGLFVPGETKKVFLKYYTTDPAHLAYWTFEDRKAYVESINQSLNYFK
ncbi:DUF262 domain-containing protein [Chitinophaga sp. OAE865]|uniref:DUF262 domain-containing protein n=1 Tax=Chitinophaga sp. OAE865 TaxID=2817898 RepID=UPI001AE2404F